MTAAMGTGPATQVPVNLGRATIVIPCMHVESLTERCVIECARLCPGADILVVADIPEGGERITPWARLIISSPVTIAAKRNLAAHSTDAEFLAFIDSDAYPLDHWLGNAIRRLDRDRRLVGVGGPNLPPEDQQGTARWVGAALKSPFVSGKWTYRKTMAAERLVDVMPSCNLVVRRQDYLAVGGMQEDLFTGEDIDWCTRIRETGRTILYTPEVAVYHLNRAFKGYFLQRLTYGAGVPKLLAGGIRLYVLLLSMPAILLAFLATLPLALLWKSWGMLYAGVVTLYLSLITMDALRQATHLRDWPGVALAILIGNLAPGLGTFLDLFGMMPDRRKIYRNFT